MDGRFVLRRLVREADQAAGAPAVWIADGPGASFVAKIWSARPGLDAAIRSVWHHEVRSLLRMDGLPRARDLFAGLEAVAADDRAFYVVVDGGGRLLLSDALASRDSHGWLRGIVADQRRSVLWRGLHTIASALEGLHEQGVLHRALDAGCVFADADGEGDFRLSGFEWSLRLNAAAHGGALGSVPGRMRAPELAVGSATWSVASDWFDFGVLAAELVGDERPAGTDLAALDNLRKRILRSRVLLEEERRLVAGLLLPNPDVRRVEHAGVVRRVAALAARLGAGRSAASPPLVLCVHLSATSGLAEPISRITDGRVRLDDADGQLEFVQDDLAEGATVAALKGPDLAYAVQGARLSYRVRRYSRRDGSANWRVGFSAGPDWGSPRAGPAQSLEARPVRVGTQAQVEAWLRDPMFRSAGWNVAFPHAGATAEAPGADAHAFLKFTNTVDALLATVRIWPVAIVGRRTAADGGEDCVVLEAKSEAARDKLARSLGLAPSAERMHEAFVEEIGEIDGETAFHIDDEPRLRRGGAGASKWLFRRALIFEGRRRYEFQRSGGSADPSLGPAYLRPADLGGSYALLERRAAAIEALGEQSAMLRALEAPGSASRDTMERVPAGIARFELDEKKLRALEAIFRAQPMFALQGPPGTGKTSLVEAMVLAALGEDPSLQFAATAQANATVENLGHKLLDAARRAPGGDLPLVVRLDQDAEKETALGPDRLGAELAATLAESELGRSAPAHLAARIWTLREGSGQEGRRERADMARLVSRAANVVLATTTSADLEELLAGGKRFDWSVVEEAGKAHGFDLALPMLASHRVLMAGDHEQLPAYNERAYLELLGDPARAREAMLAASSFVPKRLAFDIGPVDTDEAVGAFEERCARWRPMMRTFGHVHAASGALPDGAAPIAARLTEQHRMHPEICDLLSCCFYPDLRTADGSRARLAGPDGFGLREGSWLPSERIVFVDLPWVQSSRQGRGQDTDRQGRFVLSNLAEAEAVVGVLGELRTPGGCDLQVLTPYNRQVAVVRAAFRRARDRGGLQGLTGFSFPKGREEFGSTIDGFQGDEADVVVVSLVRNNHAPLTGGVGHLSERARLNVMLSRARRKLVLVGSWEFFARRAGEDARKDPGSRMHHLAVVFHELGEAIRHGTAARVAFPGGGA